MSTAIQDFLEHEADLLDARRYREWLDLFAPDSYYWIPIHPDQDDPRAMPSHVFEKRPVLAARVERLYDTRVVPQQPHSRTSRLIGAARIDGEHAAGPIARGRFQIVEARTTHEEHNDVRIFAGHVALCADSERQRLQNRVEARRRVRQRGGNARHLLHVLGRSGG